MNRRQYWKNRIPFLLTNLICMVALTVFLLVCGNPISVVLLISAVWALILLAGLFLTYWKRQRQMRQLLDMTGQLSERYRFRSDGVAGTGRGSGLLSAFENGRKIYVGTDWNGLSGTSGIQGIY